MLKTLCGFFFCGRSYEALIGIVSHDTFDWLSDKQSRFATASGLESGSIDTATDSLSPEQRDRIYQSYVRNHYKAHLKEILLIVQNEYTDWDASHASAPEDTRDQVSPLFKNSPIIIHLLFYLRKDYLRKWRLKFSKN